MRESGPRRSRRPPWSGDGGGRPPRPIGRNHARRTQRDGTAGSGRRRACQALAGRWGELDAAVPYPAAAPSVALIRPVLPSRSARGWANARPSRSGARALPPPPAAGPPLPPFYLRGGCARRQPLRRRGCSVTVAGCQAPGALAGEAAPCRSARRRRRAGEVGRARRLGEASRGGCVLAQNLDRVSVPPGVGVATALQRGNASGCGGGIYLRSSIFTVHL